MLDHYEHIVKTWPLLSSFVKFAILATLGEAIACKIKTQKWPTKTFGILPKTLVWGFLGIFIYYAFRIFSAGIPPMIGGVLPVSGNTTADNILSAFYISTFMNVIFAPVMMTLHKLTDIKIEMGSGTFSALFSREISISQVFDRINWDQLWGFVFKKTIPFFWIPAHTLTFLLPPSYRVLFAAILSVMLGIILAIASSVPGASQD